MSISTNRFLLTHMIFSRGDQVRELEFAQYAQSYRQKMMAKKFELVQLNFASLLITMIKKTLNNTNSDIHFSSLFDLRNCNKQEENQANHINLNILCRFEIEKLENPLIILKNGVLCQIWTRSTLTFVPHPWFIPYAVDQVIV